MNNSHPILRTKLSESQTACIDLLKEALAEALEGNITSIGVVACMKGGFATVMAGTQAADLHLGCADLQRKILGAVTEDGNVAKPTVGASILRVRQ